MFCHIIKIPQIQINLNNLEHATLDFFLGDQIKHLNHFLSRLL